tara:strand:+ start:118 stop:363 length:246 start_codon:yes stop_codon:yes gene_type:complete
MIDELYDEVLNVMEENGFIKWFETNQNKVSPLKWCYDNGGVLKSPPKPPKGVKWLGNTYDSLQYHPKTIQIDGEGVVSEYL